MNKCANAIGTKKGGLSRKYVTEEEALLISTYTYGDKPEDEKPYELLNKKFREGKVQDKLVDKKSYCRLLLRALRKLPRTRCQTLYRGIREGEYEYIVGKDINWKGFSSTSTKMMATQHFLTDMKAKNPNGTSFTIEKEWGYNITDFSVYWNEEGTII